MLYSSTAIDLGSEDEKRIAVAEDGARIGLHEIDTHFFITADENLSGLGGSILHYGGVLDVFDIGREGMKVLRRVIQHGHDAVERPGRSGLCGERLGPDRGATKTNQSKNHK